MVDGLVGYCDRIWLFGYCDKGVVWLLTDQVGALGGGCEMDLREFVGNGPWCINAADGGGGLLWVIRGTTCWSGALVGIACLSWTFTGGTGFCDAV